MFALGAAFALFGYTAIYVAGFRLAGDTRTVVGIIEGQNGGNMVRDTSSSVSNASTASQIAAGASGVLAGTAVTGGNIVSGAVDGAGKVIGSLPNTVKKLVP